MTAEAKVQIAVVGHTNTGKTSLLRTLTRESGFGVVSARSASTRDVSGVALICDGTPALALFAVPVLAQNSAQRQIPWARAEPRWREWASSWGSCGARSP